MAVAVGSSWGFWGGVVGRRGVLLRWVGRGCRCVPWRKRPPPAAAGPASTQSAWRWLFNGQDLSGWRVVGSAVWRVDHKDGWPDMIVGGQDGDPKRSGNLVTVDEFQN